MRKIKFIDLFAGMGGIRLGLEEACQEKHILCDCVFTSEIKQHAIQAYQKNMKNVISISGDIRQVESSKIPNFDILLAGFPCQPFSTAGNKKGFKDTRGTLFFEIERILKDKQPSAFILENVFGLVNHDKGNTFKVILDTLNKLGYKVTWKIIDSQYHGVPQARKRIYIIGTKDNTINIDLDNFPIKQVKLKEILEDGIKLMNNDFSKKVLSKFTTEYLEGKAFKDKRGGKNNIHTWDYDYRGETTTSQKELLNKILTERRQRKYAKEYGIEWQDGMPLTLNMIHSFYNKCDINDLKIMLDDLVKKEYLRLKYPKKIVNDKKIDDTDKEIGYDISTDRLSLPLSRILDSNSVSLTITATDDSYGIADRGGIRNLSIREELRLQGYPEWYDLSFLPRNKAHDLVGNSVCVPVIKNISLKLLDGLFSDK